MPGQADKVQRLSFEVCLGRDKSRSIRVVLYQVLMKESYVHSWHIGLLS